jgi:hypothetical protein
MKKLTTMKYIKNAVEVEAMQFTEESKQDVYNWCKDIQMNIQAAFRDETPALLVPTLEGTMVCNIGDYLIKEPFPTDWRKFYPCKPDI